MPAGTARWFTRGGPGDAGDASCRFRGCARSKANAAAAMCVLIWHHVCPDSAALACGAASHGRRGAERRVVQPQGNVREGRCQSL